MYYTKWTLIQLLTIGFLGKSLIFTLYMVPYNPTKFGRNRLKNKKVMKENSQICPTYGVLTLGLESLDLDNSRPRSLFKRKYPII